VGAGGVNPFGNPLPVQSRRHKEDPLPGCLVVLEETHSCFGLAAGGWPDQQGDGG
jgi:hypothetical protein